MASPATFAVTPSSFGVGSVHNTKIDFGKLYMHQIFGGSSMNQSKVVEPSAVTGLGETAVNNWGIYDGDSSGAELVAYGQGMHTFAGNWQNWFTMVFELQRFKGSTLQIMGASLDKSNDWAIVGGTGDFEMAYGVIHISEYKVTGDGKIHELTIDGYCRRKLPPVPAPTRMGPWGGSGGLLRQMEGKSRRLESVTVSYQPYRVDTISFSYVNENGQSQTGGPWGYTEADNSFPNTTVTTIKFGPSEFVKAISGTVSTMSVNVFSNFKIITNIATYGPFATLTYTNTSPTNGSFNVTVPANKTVVGFFVYADGGLLNRIGFYTI